MKNRYTTLLLFLIGVLSAEAQDIHFTQFDLSPLNVNPAIAGGFLGSFRLGGIIRDQDRTIAGSSGYTSFGFYADAPVIEGLREKDWVGIGLNFYSDKAGDTQLKRSASHITLSYHAGFGPKSKTNSVLSLGIQFGRISQSFDETALGMSQDGVFLDSGRESDDLEKLTGSQSGGPAGVANMNNGFSDWNVGLKYKVILDKTSNIEMGGALYHIQFGDNFVFDSLTMMTRRVEPLIRPRFTAFVSYETEMSKKMSLNPRLLLSTTQGSLEILPQILATFLLNEETDIKFDAGLGFRITGAPDAQLLLGMRKKDLRIGLAFDLNLVGQTPATNGFRGVELGVSYIGKIYKKPKPVPILICPRH